MSGGQDEAAEQIETSGSGRAARCDAICLDCGAPLWARSHTWCERTKVPFYEHRIFARFTIMPAFPGEDVADEYALERDAVLGVIVWGLFRGQWIRQPWNMSPVNRWLVARIDELKRIKEAP